MKIAIKNPIFYNSPVGNIKWGINNNPQDSVEMKKIQQWGFIQLVKAFLGIPIVPGR